MKHKFIVLASLLIITALYSSAGVPITKVDAIDPTDEVFIDMAVTAASTSVENGGLPCGAVVIYNGAWRSTGMPEGDKTAEVSAMERSRLSDLSGARIYTLNEPTTETLNALNKAGVIAVYFVNDSEDVVAAGIYPASAYAESALDRELKQVPLVQISYPDGENLIKQYSKAKK